MSKNELIPEVRLDKNNVSSTKWVRKDTGSSTASIPAPSLGGSTKYSSPTNSGPKVSWSRLGRLAVTLERIFPWTNSKRERVFDRLRSAALDDVVEGLRNLDTSKFGVGIGRSSSRSQKVEPTIQQSEHAVQPFLNATESLSSKAMEFTLKTLTDKNNTRSRGLFRMVPTDFDFDDFVAVSGKETEAEFMNVAALRGAGVHIRADKESLFRMQELRKVNPVFDRADLFNLSPEGKEQAAAILDVADHLRAVSPTSGHFTDGRDWLDHNTTVSPKLASFIMSDPSRAEDVKKFYSLNDFDPKRDDLNRIREFIEG